MLVLDLDGTTLRRDGSLAEEDQRAVRRLQEIGVIVTIATGRLFSGTTGPARALGIDGPVACMNGSDVRHVASHDQLVGRYLSAGVRDLAAHAIRDADLSAFLFTTGTIHYGPGGEPITRYLRMWTEDFVGHADLVSSVPWREAADALAIAVVGGEEEVHAARDQVAAGLDDDQLEIVSFPSVSDKGVWFMKVRDGIEDKGTALGRLAAHHGLCADDCVSVGDWLNDVPMLRAAGRSFAVGDAIDRVAAAATDRCTTAGGQGGVVAEVARRVWGIDLEN